MSDNQLGEFLRARRARVTPQEHGLEPGGERRTPGLRRDEVAMLAGVSTDYYVRLEQGRDRNPSPQVLLALAEALRLDGEAVAHLQALTAPRATYRSRPEVLDDGLAALMERWPDTPALVLGRYQDLLGANTLGGALFGWLGEERNLLRAIFLKPEARDFYPAWELIIENCVASLRAAADPDDLRLTELVGELSVRSPAFAELWARHEVRAKTREERHYRHPLVGDLHLTFEMFTVNSAPGQQLTVYRAEHGSPSEGALRLLATITTSRME